MRPNFVLAMITAAALSGCATIVKSDRQTVILSGGDENGTTTINIPDGKHELADGNGQILVSRSKQDIPISVTCNGVTKKGVIPTRFDWGWAGLGNAVFGGIPGWIIDGVGDKAYDPKSPFNVDSLCEKRAPAALARP